MTDASGAVPDSGPESSFRERIGLWSAVFRLRVGRWAHSVQEWSAHRAVSTVLPLGLLLAAVLLYCIVFGRLVVRQHDLFGTFGFDLGIYDQVLWLLSRFQIPFMTVRGLHFLGHHVNLSTFLLAPFYWVGAGPRFLVVVNVVVLAAGAVPLWLITRDRLRSGWMGLVIGVVYLLLPSVEWITRWHFHPDALTMVPLLFAWWFSMRRWWKAYAIAVVFLLAAKEDAALAVALLGVLVTVRLDRRVGLATFAAGVAWFLVATKLIIPHYSPSQEAFYVSFFVGGGDGLLSVLWNIVRHPVALLNTLTDQARVSYDWMLFAPVAFLPFLAPSALAVMAIALPQFLANSLSSHSYTHDIMYHYSTVINGVIMLATVEAVGSLGRRARDRWYLLAVLLVVVTVAHVQWSPSPLGKKYDTGIWAQAVDPSQQRAMREAVELIPDRASVSATYNLVPHLTHRTAIYEFPNPWLAANWGVAGEGLPDPTTVDYLALIVRPDALGEGQPRSLMERLTAPDGEFEVVYEREGVLVARRRGTEGPE